MIESMGERTAHIHRQTRETNVTIDLNLDGTGTTDLAGPVCFLNHMLDAFGRHGHMDLTVEAQGDIEVDEHHTIEDIGIVLGMAVREALGDCAGITRYGSELVPMDEALVLAAIDVSGRGQAHVDVQIPGARVGDFDCEMLREFMIAFAANAGITLHMRQLAGVNSHHIIEACFKALGRALMKAAALDPQVAGVPSTKGDARIQVS